MIELLLAAGGGSCRIPAVSHKGGWIARHPNSDHVITRVLQWL